MQDINIRIKTLLDTKSIKQSDINKDEKLKNLKVKLNATLDTSKIKQSTINKDGNLKSLEVKIKPILDVSSSSVKQFQSQINQLAKMAKVTLKVDVDTSKANESIRKATSVNTSQGLTPIQQRINSSVGINSSGINSSARESAKVFQDLFNASSSFEGSMTNAERSVRSLNPQIKELNNNVEKSGQSLLSAGKKFLTWLAMGTLIMQPILFLKNGISTIYELDTAITDLKKVSDELGDSAGIKEFTSQVNQMAIEIGHSTKSAIDAITEFKRLGYSLSDAEALGKQALIYSNIGDVDIDKASQTLISTLKGFNLEANETLRIMDALNEVGNTTSISSAGIGEALRRSSSALSEANNTLEESIALIVGANASVQNPESVGTGLKTMSLRIRGISEETGEAIPQLDGLIKRITGVNVMADATTFKSTYEIMKEIAGVWKDIDDIDQANLLEELFGKRQANIGASLLNNFSDSVKAYETALNSAGSSAKEQEAYMDSMEAKVNKFKETITKLWIDSTNSDMFKNIIDGGTKLIEVLNKLVNNDLSQFIMLMGISAYAGKALNLVFTGLQKSILDTTKTFKALTVTMLKSPLFWGAVAGFAIWGIVKAIDKANISYAEQKEKLEKTTSEYNNLKTELESLNSELDTTKSRLDELNGKETLTIVEADEKKKLEETNDELERKVRLTEALEKIKKKEKQENAIEFSKKVGESKLRNTVYKDEDGWGTMTSKKGLTDLEEFKFYNKTLKDTKQALIDLDETYEGGKKNPEEYAEKTKLINDVQDEAKKSLLELSQSFQTQADTLKGADGEGQKLRKTYLDNVEAIDEMINGLSDAKVPDWYDKNIKANKDMVNKFADDYNIDLNNYKTLAELKEDVENKLYSNINNINDDMINALVDKYGIDLGEFATVWDKKVAIAKAASDSIVKMQGILAGNTRKTIGGVLKMTSMQIDKNTEMGKILAKNGVDIDKANIANHALANTQSAYRELENWYNSVGSESDYSSALAEIDKIYGESKKTTGNTGGGSPSGGGSGGKGSSKSSPSPIDPQDMTEAFLKSANARVEITKFQNESLERQIKIADRAKDYTKELELQDKLLDNQNVTVAELKIANDKIHQEAERVRKLSKYGQQSNNWFDINGEASAEYMQLLNSFAGKTDEASKKAYESIKSLFDSLYKLKQGWNANTQEIYEMQDAIDSVKQSMQDVLTKQYSAMQKSATKQLAKEKKALEEELKNDNEYYDNKIQKIQDKIDALEKESDIENKLLNIEKARIALAKVQDQKTKRIYKDGEFVWDIDHNAVSDAQSSLDDLLSDWNKYQKKLDLQEQVDDFKRAKEKNERTINDQIKDLENLSNVWSESLDISDEIDGYSGNLDNLVGLETDSYEERLKLARQFAKDYADAMSKITSGSYSSGGSSSGGYSGSGGSSGGREGGEGYYAHAGADGKAPSGLKEGTTVHTKGGDYKIDKVNKDGSYQSHKVYKKGGLVNYTGIAQVDGSPSEPEWMLNAEQTKAFKTWMTIDPSIINSLNVKALDSSKFVRRDVQPSIQLSMGNIVVQGVQDVNGLSKAIINKLPNQIIQDLYKK